VTASDTANDQHVGRHEDEKDRRQHQHRLAHTADVDDGEHDDEGRLDDELVFTIGRRQKAEQRVASRGDRDRNGHDVVDQQRTARDHAEPRPEQLGRHQVAAAAVRKLLDDVAVGVGDDTDRQRRQRRQHQRQRRVVAERAKRLLGSVRGRRQTVGAEANPGQ